MQPESCHHAQDPFAQGLGPYTEIPVNSRIGQKTRRDRHRAVSRQAEHGHALSVIARFFLLLSIFPVCAATQAALASDSKDLVINGDLTRGTGTMPDAWKSDSWLTGPGISSFAWHRTAHGGELTIINHQPNDARWVQHLHLAPGWYRFTAEVRATKVGGDHLGASIAVIQGWVSSADLRGNQDWQSLEFYLHVGGAGADVELACRLGGFSNENIGEAVGAHVEDFGGGGLAGQRRAGGEQRCGDLHRRKRRLRARGGSVAQNQRL